MTSFPSAARRVRDDELPAVRRLWALRECALRFGPYGFRATWHHLVVGSRIPEDLDADPYALVRAVDELEEARGLWLPELRAYEGRRRLEKAHRRVPEPGQAPRLDLYCPNPEVHPRERLAIVVARAIGRVHPDEDICAGCAGPRRYVGTCPACGICEDRTARPCAEERWKAIWRRRVELPGTRLAG